MCANSVDLLLQNLASAHLPEIELSLGRMYQLLERLGNPQEQLPPSVHVAGTNGKGSTIAFIRAIYEAAGYRVHVYTSPHLVRFHERIVLAGHEVSDAVLRQALQRVHEASKQVPVTYFEATTAAAFLCFSESKADILLLETGLGGEFDATNVVPNKRAAVITPIAYDHQEFLGGSLHDIARAKAGIIVENGICITAPQPAEALEVLQKTCAKKQAELICATTAAKGLALGLSGAHQYINAGVAIAAAKALSADFPVDEKAIQAGLQQAAWPARLQPLYKGALIEARPNAHFFLDGGHNPHAAKALAQWLETQNRPRYLWLAMRQMKDVAGFVAPLAPLVDGIITLPIPDCSDGLLAKQLAQIIEKTVNIRVHAVENIDEAAKLLNCDEKATVLIAGSLYLAGYLLKTHAS